LHICRRFGGSCSCRRKQHGYSKREPLRDCTVSHYARHYSL